MSKSSAAPLVYTEGNIIMQNAYLTAKEQQVVQLVVSVYNRCHYCTSAHSKFSEKKGVSHEDVSAMRKGRLPKEKGIRDLAFIIKLIMDKKGQLNKTDLEKINATGIKKAKLYEVLAHIGLKTFANYAANIIHPEIDEQFKFQE